MRNVLVVIEADPARSERALEALRMSVGLTLGGNRVRILLSKGGSGLSDPAGQAFPDWPVAESHLRAFREVGGTVSEGPGTLEDLAAADVVIRWTE